LIPRRAVEFTSGGRIDLPIRPPFCFRLGRCEYDDSRAITGWPDGSTIAATRLGDRFSGVAAPGTDQSALPPLILSPFHSTIGVRCLLASSVRRAPCEGSDPCQNSSRLDMETKRVTTVPLRQFGMQIVHED
jgi:hypothetical protein